MAEAGLDAVAVGPGTGLVYLSGVRWGGAERLFCMVLAREGDPAWVTPALEQKRAQELIPFGSDIRAWHEHESSYVLVAGILADRSGMDVGVGIHPVPEGLEDRDHTRGQVGLPAAMISRTVSQARRARTPRSSRRRKKKGRSILGW